MRDVDASVRGSTKKTRVFNASTFACTWNAEQTSSHGIGEFCNALVCLCVLFLQYLAVKMSFQAFHLLLFFFATLHHTLQKRSLFLSKWFCRILQDSVPPYLFYSIIPFAVCFGLMEVSFLLFGTSFFPWL